MPRKTAYFDVACVIGISLLYVGFEVGLVPKRWSYLAVAVFFAAFLAHVARRGADSWRELGFRLDNIFPSIKAVGLFTLIAGGAIIVWAVVEGRATWSRQVAILLTLYPPWAIVQQLACQGMLHRNLMVLLPSRTLQVLITSSAFAGIHVGNAPLVLLTFLAGVSWSLLYRRYPNLWILGASHTVLAALVYPLVLGDDPLSRF